MPPTDPLARFRRGDRPPDRDGRDLQAVAVALADLFAAQLPCGTYEPVRAVRRAVDAVKDQLDRGLPARSLGPELLDLWAAAAGLANALARRVDLDGPDDVRAAAAAYAVLARLQPMLERRQRRREKLGVRSAPGPTNAW